MGRRKIVIHGVTVLGLMFLIGSSCSNNDGLKAQLAAQQQQAAMQAQYQAQMNQLQMQNQTMQQKQTDYQRCISGTGNTTGCAQLLN